MNVAPWMWAGFVGFILAMLLLDLLVFHKDAHEVKVREATMWVAIWVSLALAFGGLLWAWQGSQVAGEYMAGYLIEWALSVDNMFVFALLFTYFAVPLVLQHRVLFWGILGALVFRALFIGAGAVLLEAFHWMIYVFGAFLIFTGFRMARSGDEEVHPEHNPVLKLLRRLIPIAPAYHGSSFFVRIEGKRFATPLLAVLVAVETTDIIFAIDSIPAIYGVTSRPFIVFTSNAFAILGLRALFFLLAGAMKTFHYLKIGLSVVLVFVGVKMVASDIVHIPVWMSLGVIALVLGASVVLSLRKREVVVDPDASTPG